ncbi:aspartyl-phosphate phosphatase Spo0E family protein [Alkalihalobacillus sp. MEB130]|uniref:aspartyl-phosphate phosphatase Spo0E family protein n=1 Tax=Alkalihalobacillus sp. MEB130 TaxID=2976704 RepID=UPI0028DFB1E4|nr:aspartyl-phosphate phosphatase Spo0E family protein [Alkalihalobacillus sp. MEB130]MDT8858623.1 aspartyl-phosphate phosphatase Spo0E family protein [Alkalihalobacillus sp. MEB130]
MHFHLLGKMVHNVWWVKRTVNGGMVEMSKVLNNDASMEKIEELRKKMVAAAGQYGLSHPIVLHYSQELDRAHNKIILLEMTRSKNWERSLTV